MNISKTIFLYMLFVLINLSAFAQKTDSVLFRIYYNYSNLNDTLKTGKTRTENMLLFIGKNTSLYGSFDKIKYELAQEQKFRAKTQNMINDGKPKAIIMDNADGEWINNSTNLYFVKENKFYSKDVLALQAYLQEEPAQKINWKISKDTLSFSGLLCQKATATIDGKNWIAWYAPSIPFPGGPGRLIGLPGLIVAAEDEYQQVKYDFVTFENAHPGDNVREMDITKRPDAQPGDYNAIDMLIGRDMGNAYFENIIRLPIGATKITKEQFKKLKDAFTKDPRGFVRARQGY